MNRLYVALRLELAGTSHTAMPVLTIQHSAAVQYSVSYSIQ
jgi:hypothetical protein